MNFGNEIISRGEEFKTQVNLSFFRKMEKRKIAATIQATDLKFSRSQMMKQVLPLDSSREI